MATNQEIHYIFSRHATDANIQLVAPLDVVYPILSSPGGLGEYFNTPMNGGFVVRVPSGVDFDTHAPRTPGDSIRMFSIQAEKATGLLAKFPGYTNYVFDDMLDATGFDASTASGCVLGGRNGVFLTDSGNVTGRIPATVDTVAVGLASTPAQATLYFEAFFVVPSSDHSVLLSAAGDGPANPKDDRMSMVFRPVTSNLSAALGMDVSFNGGSTFITNVLSEDLINIAPADQGNSLIVRFYKPNSSVSFPTGISSWAVIY